MGSPMGLVDSHPTRAAHLGGVRSDEPSLAAFGELYNLQAGVGLFEECARY